MAHPKRKTSKSRGRKRRTHQRVSVPSLVECKNCRRLKPAHMVCPFCGYYRNKEIIEIKVKESKKKR
ncbi:MAG: 50S ribosomal protein L32 [Candidatus Omnitrophica bacterium]|nr:50S ribosomal protein L32 [Candidatus Omnitrophota bacterium]MBD3269692.1 50S ribosomal protein L32 [Candidatus Omnitrophota bacterium]